MTGNVLVTGGAGFIGSHLVDSLLSDGFAVRVLDDLSSGNRCNLSQDAELVLGSVTDQGAVADAMDEIDLVFHLAARPSVDESLRHLAASHSINLSGTIAVLEASLRSGRSIPVVYASSAAVYGDNQDLPLKETAAIAPQSPYGADKFGCELHAGIVTRTLGLPTIGLRFFNVYGPRQSPSSPYSGVISIFADKILNGEPITVHGDGLQTRDFIYVTDVVRFLRAAAKRANGGVLNVGTSQETSILQLVSAMYGALGVAEDIRFAPARPGDIARSCADCSAALEELGISAQTDLATGLAETLSWMSTKREQQIG